MRLNRRKLRRNGDDEIRRLERIAIASKDPSDIAAYWLACIRRGELPQPTTEDDMGPVWFLQEGGYRKKGPTFHKAETESWWVGGPMVVLNIFASGGIEVSYTIGEGKTSPIADITFYDAKDETDPRVKEALLYRLTTLLAEHA